VLDGRKTRTKFREIEVERVGGGRKLLDKVEQVLREAGAVAGDFTPKLIRALGSAATEPPDLVPPPSLGRKPKAGEVVTAAICKGVARTLSHDPLVRLRAPVGDNDTAVHQMRVGCRRLRSDLRTFAPLVDPAWSGRLREELGWLADALGGARDAEVLRARLRRTAAADPLAPPDGVAVARIDADLAARQEDALLSLDKVLASDRYLALVDMLIEACRAPRLTPLAGRPAAEVLPRLVAKPWRQLAYGSRGVDGAADLDPAAPDEQWHAVRIRGKRARYAVEAVAGVLGGGAAELGKALGAVQDLLGEHQDAALAADTWLSIALSDPDDHTLAVTAGRLFERERAVIRGVRAEFPAAWQAATKRRMVEWLP
jgi:CHAD domain-containing protein